MKKILLLSTLTIVVVTLSSFKNITSDFTPKTNSLNESYQQQQTVYAWRMAGGNWQQGTVTYQNTQQGLKPISYDFSSYTNGGRGQFMPDARFMPLNPNNELAKKNNWTHSISSMAGTLYLSIY